MCHIPNLDTIEKYKYGVAAVKRQTVRTEETEKVKTITKLRSE
jgi:hypothetical protein